jgi:hypothetical protein
VPVATNNPVEALNVKRFGAPPALTSKSSGTTAVGFGNPVNAMVGAEISPAVAVDPAKVIFHADVAAAVSGLRCVLNGAGAPAVVAVIVAVTPLGHAATVSSVNVPVIPPEFGRIRAFAVLARTFPTVLEDVGLGVGAGVATPPIGIGFVVPLAHPTTSADKRRDVVLVRTPNRKLARMCAPFLLWSKYEKVRSHASSSSYPSIIREARDRGPTLGHMKADRHVRRLHCLWSSQALPI